MNRESNTPELLCYPFCKIKTECQNGIIRLTFSICFHCLCKPVLSSSSMPLLSCLVNCSWTLKAHHPFSFPGPLNIFFTILSFLPRLTGFNLNPNRGLEKILFFCVCHFPLPYFILFLFF